MNSYIKEDINNLLLHEKNLLDSFSNKTIFITGATGLIGSQLVFTLLEANKKYKLNIRVLALVRSLQKAKQVFAEYMGDSCLKVVCGDVLALPEILEPIDYVVHGASVTSSWAFVHQPIDTINTAICGAMAVLNLAKEKKVQAFVYLSSLEVYGVTSNENIGEEDIGSIDFLNVRSSYSESKRMVECLCVAYAKQYGVPTKIARLTQTFGPGISHDDNRVFAQFARSIVEDRDIVLHTTGETKRTYCYTSDAVSGILYILQKGKVAEAYNVANAETFFSIMEMAKLLVSLKLNACSKIVVDMQDLASLGYLPVIKIKLKTEKLQNLGWVPRVGMLEMLKRLVLAMKEKRLH